jgi:TRAP-type C4-dicarboxylate transport system permease small subunit
MSRAMRLLERFVTVGANGGRHVAGIGLFAGAIVVFVQVVIRYGELAPVSFGDELSGYILALSAFVASPDAFRSGALPRLVILADRLRGWVREIAEGLGLLSGLIFSSVLVYQAWGLFAESWRYRATSILLEVPLWIPQGAMLIGVAGLWLTVALAAVRRVSARPSEPG